MLFMHARTESWNLLNNKLGLMKSEPQNTIESSTPQIQQEIEVVVTEFEDVRPACSLRSIVSWILSWSLPGAGLFFTAFYIFSIGNLRPLFEIAYPDCWSPVEQASVCSTRVKNAAAYASIAGIVFGNLSGGLLADALGRRHGSIATITIMLLGACLITASMGPDEAALFIVYAVSFSVYGIGVGAEYPVAAAAATERKSASSKRKRGQGTVLSFSMQGWGNLCNTLLLLLLVHIFGTSSHNLKIVWRLSYALGIPGLLALLIWRACRMKESTVWQEKKGALTGEIADNTHSWHKKQKLLVKHYWHRLFGTASAWFLWDVAFYGNKLFQTSFILLLRPNAGLQEILGYTALNSAVSLVGYYAAAFTIDKPWMGRRRMQFGGFVLQGILFLVMAIAENPLGTPSGLPWFQALYYLAGFFGQFGPNATTFLLPAEVFPTDMRAKAHGFSAACGQAGALVAGIAFAFLGNSARLYTSAIASLCGALTTILFIPELSACDLACGDERWFALLKGEEYKGDATHPANLSLYERVWALKETNCCGGSPSTV